MALLLLHFVVFYGTYLREVLFVTFHILANIPIPKFSYLFIYLFIYAAFVDSIHPNKFVT